MMSKLLTSDLKRYVGTIKTLKKNAQYGVIAFDLSSKKAYRDLHHSKSKMLNMLSQFLTSDLKRHIWTFTTLESPKPLQYGDGTKYSLKKYYKNSQNETIIQRQKYH